MTQFKLSIIVFLTILLANTTFAQSVETDSVSKAEISKLGFLIGNWEGQGWHMSSENKKFEFNQTEKIQFKLDSTTILIEGLGIANNRIIHNAMAIISYNKKDKNYIFQSYLQNGNKGEFRAELIDRNLYWYPNESMRHKIWLNEKEQWQEIGEINKNDEWYQFFDMTLNRNQ